MTMDELAALDAIEKRWLTNRGIEAAERALEEARRRRARTDCIERHLAVLRARAAS